MDEDEYVFTATLDTPHTIAADAFCLTAKRALANKLRPIFQQYPTVSSGASMNSEVKRVLTR